MGSTALTPSSPSNRTNATSASIKPPFVITTAQADRVLAVLDELLTELEAHGLPD